MVPQETRKSLIIKLKAEQDESAWRDFVGTYEKFLEQLARKYSIPERDVPDVTQQILLSLAKSIPFWKDDGKEGSFRRWLSVVAKNIAIRYLETERKHPSPKGGTDQVDLLNKLEEHVDAEQTKRYQHELILWAAQEVRSEFLDTSWRAFWETVVEDRSVEEVAKEIDISPGSIYMSRSRIMARIRKRIREIDNEQQ